jgi:hypothetical protein
LWSGGWFFSIIVAGLAYAALMRHDRSRLTSVEYGAITEIVPEASPQGIAAACVTIA